MDGQHSRRNPMEPDWTALIRAELDAHSPRRLELLLLTGEAEEPKPLDLPVRRPAAEAAQISGVRVVGMSGIEDRDFLAVGCRRLVQDDTVDGPVDAHAVLLIDRVEV